MSRENITFTCDRFHQHHPSLLLFFAKGSVSIDVKCATVFCSFPLCFPLSFAKLCSRYRDYSIIPLTHYYKRVLFCCVWLLLAVIVKSVGKIVSVAILWKKIHSQCGLCRALSSISIGTTTTQHWAAAQKRSFRGVLFCHQKILFLQSNETKKKNRWFYGVTPRLYYVRLTPLFYLWSIPPRVVK